MARTLIQDGTVLTMDPDIGDLGRGDVLVDGDTIQAVGQGLDASGAEVVDASGHVVIPGLVNTHAHLFQTALRGVAADWTLSDYFEGMLASLRPVFEPEDVYLGDLFGAFEQLNAGVTTVLDWCHVVNTPAHADRAVDALQDSGIRAIYAYGPPGVDIGEWYGDSSRDHPQDVRRMREERLDDDEARVTLGMALRGPDLSTYDVTAHDIELARELGVLASFHIGAATYEGPGDHGVPRMADDGLLGPDINFVHANQLTQEMYPMAADAGVSISVTPEVEMQMGHGLPATGKYRDAGGRWVLGSDVVSSVGSDLFSQMRIALQTQRGLDNDELIQAREPVEDIAMEARDVLRAGTIEGAKALGLDDRVGSLTPGKRADVTMVSTEDVNTFPLVDPVATVVLHATPGNVDRVYVDGELVKADGELLDPAVDERRDDLAASGQRLLEDAGLRP